MFFYWSYWSCMKAHIEVHCYALCIEFYQIDSKWSGCPKWTFPPKHLKIDIIIITQEFVLCFAYVYKSWDLVCAMHVGPWQKAFGKQLLHFISFWKISKCSSPISVEHSVPQTELLYMLWPLHWQNSRHHIFSSLVHCVYTTAPVLQQSCLSG